MMDVYRDPSDSLVMALIGDDKLQRRLVWARPCPTSYPYRTVCQRRCAVAAQAFTLSFRPLALRAANLTPRHVTAYAVATRSISVAMRRIISFGVGKRAASLESQAIDAHIRFSRYKLTSQGFLAAS
jgi:hypothetical protein